MSDDYFSPNNPMNYWAREADLKANQARLDAEAARTEASIERKRNDTNFETILQMSAAKRNQEEIVGSLKKENATLLSEKYFYKGLLSLPMREIAEKNGDFKKTYEEEQLVLAKWILNSKAYAETTMQLGLNAGKTPEEIKKLHTENIAAVLTNTTKHGNDAVTNPVLKDNVNKILKKNK